MKRKPTHYDHLTREQLLEHLIAYSSAYHKVAAECQKLRLRFANIEKHREFFGEITVERVTI